MKKSVIFPILLLLSIAFVSAHEEETITPSNTDLSTTISLYFLAIAGLNTLILATIAILTKKNMHNREKKTLFLGISIPILLASLFLVGSVVYTNIQSDTNGPVHWHADFEVWACGEKLALKSPEGLSNRIGTPLFHEHGDNRIHIEGTITDLSDINLHSFFEVIGGKLTKETLRVPTEEGLKEFATGEACNGTVQVFVYKTTDETVTQEKLTDFEEYVISPSSLVPPGDCLIIEFEPERENTEHICDTYGEGE